MPALGGRGFTRVTSVGTLLSLAYVTGGQTMLDAIHAKVTRRNFIRGLGLLSASAALAACAQATTDENKTDGASASAGGAAGATPLLAIIHTNDTHGHDVAVEGTDSAEGNFSMAAVPALKAEWEKKGYEVLLVDAGDATQGMPLVDTSKGTSAIAFMNACGYDLMTVGNHEFDWGTDALAANESAAKFPFLSANVFEKESGKLRFAANKVVELQSGTKVGFFGLTTPATVTTANPKNVESFKFSRDEELYDVAKAQVEELRGKGCDLVVCVGHLGNDEVKSGTSRTVLEQVDGIDLFIDGHDHQKVEEEVAGTLLVETGCYMHNIGVVVIDEGAPNEELVAAGTFDGIDESVKAIIDKENDRVESELAVVLGSTSFLLNGEREPGVRTEETNLGDFCTDAFRWTASTELGKEVDASILGGGSIRTSVEPGDISLAIIKTVMPFSNDLAVVEVTGAQLLEALEAACQAVGKGQALGAFPQVSGITFELDASIPYEEGPTYPDSTYASPASPGSRVTITDVAGRGFDKGETYSIATASFFCAGGDTYHAFKEAADAKAPVTFCFDYEAIVSYLVEKCDHQVPSEYAKPQERIIIAGA